MELVPYKEWMTDKERIAYEEELKRREALIGDLGGHSGEEECPFKEITIYEDGGVKVDGLYYTKEMLSAIEKEDMEISIRYEGYGKDAFSDRMKSDEGFRDMIIGNIKAMGAIGYKACIEFNTPGLIHFVDKGHTKYRVKSRKVINLAPGGSYQNGWEYTMVDWGYGHCNNPVGTVTALYK